MPKTKKTDNTSLSSKLALRRYFLDKYHAGSGRKKIKVFDACEGEQVIWGILRKEYPCRYWGVDKKKRKGRLSIQSERVLAEPGWDFDVIDIDTYGQPWRHWRQVLRQGRDNLTVFLTVGIVLIGGIGSLQNRHRDEVFPPFKTMPKPPKNLFFKFRDYSIIRAIGSAYKRGFDIVECNMIQSAHHTKYFGVRLKKREKKHDVKT